MAAWRRDLKGSAALSINGCLSSWRYPCAVSQYSAVLTTASSVSAIIIETHHAFSAAKTGLLKRGVAAQLAIAMAKWRLESGQQYRIGRRSLFSAPSAGARSQQKAPAKPSVVSEINRRNGGAQRRRQRNGGGMAAASQSRKAAKRRHGGSENESGMWRMLRQWRKQRR